MNGFREAAEVDADAVVALWRASGLTGPGVDPYKDVSRARQSRDAALLLREEAGIVTATVMVQHDGDCGTLHYVAVAPDWRRRGMGSQAVRAAEAWLARRGVSRVNLLLRAENAAVRGFYEALGYEVNLALCMARKSLGGQEPLRTGSADPASLAPALAGQTGR